MQGKPWKVEKVFDTFELADKKRQNILKSAENIQVKVKRMAAGKFAVKTRVNLDDSIDKKKVDESSLSPKKLRQEKKRRARERRAKKQAT